MSITPPVPAALVEARRALSVWGPLNAFCLPGELARALSVRTAEVPSEAPQPLEVQAEAPPAATSVSRDPEAPDSGPAESPGHPAAGGLTCAVCRAHFASLDAQRSHFRSEWHRYNLGLCAPSASNDRTHKGPESYTGVSEEDFVRLVAELDQGSESEGQDDVDSTPDGGGGTVARLLRRTRLAEDSSSEDDDDEEARASAPGGSALIYLSAAPLLPPAFELSIYRSILPTLGALRRPEAADTASAVSELQNLQVTSSVEGKPSHAADSETEDTRKGSEHWLLLMMGGGHFAAAVMNVAPKLRPLGKGKYEKVVDVVEHKTFHRYTTRRKQGGGQSAHDSGGKGAAKSAGAGLRRYNEQALFDDIRQVLGEWSELISSASLIFVRGSKSNMSHLYSSHPAFASSPLHRGDPRLRSFPFSTRRPGFEELKRCFMELCRVRVDEVSDEEWERRRKEAEKAAAALAAKAEAKEREREREREREQEAERAKAKAKAMELSEEEKRRLEKWEKVLEMTTKGRVDALKSFLDRNAQEPGEVDWINSRVPEAPPGEGSSRKEAGWTLLHVAAVADQPDVVDLLLSDLYSADPTALSIPAGGASSPALEAPSPCYGKTPYELGPSRATRNVFRRHFAARPDAWDWHGRGRVPSALSEEMEALQSGKTKERKSKLKSKLKERDAARKARDEAERKASEAEAAAEAREAVRRVLEGKGPGKQRLGGPASGLLHRERERETEGLSEQQKMRLERERRARAAEARLKALGGG